MLQNRDNSRKWNDVGFAIAFYISVAFNTTFAVFGVFKYGEDLLDTNINKIPKIKLTDIIYILCICGCSILFSLFWLFLVSSCPTIIIKASLVFELVLFITVGLVGAIMINPLIAIAPFFLGFIRLVWLFFIWRYIPFCQSILTVALTAFKKCYSPVLIHILMAIIAWLILIIDLVSILASNKLFNVNSDKSVALFSIGFIQLVFLLWHVLALENVAHVTSCGVMIQYLQRQTISVMKKFVQAATILFGSICFGTLLEAIIRALTMLAEQRESEARRDGNPMQMVCWCCISCLLRVLGDLLYWINSYAYVYVAKNHEPYLKSGKSVWNMLKNKGLLPLVNDLVLETPAVVGFIFLCVLIGCISFLFIIGTSVSWVAFGIGILLGMFIYKILVSVITAYVKVVFVMWAEDHNVFEANQPEYGALLNQAAGMS